MTADDLAALVDLHVEDSFWHYPLGRGQTPAETRDFLAAVLAGYADAGLGIEAVVERRSGALAGWAGLSVPRFLPEILPAVEVGWRLGSAWRGRGYATEAGAAWVRFGFEQRGLDRIVSVFEPANRASGRVMEKLGFRLERVTTHPVRRVEVHVTELDRRRWDELSAAGRWPLPAPPPPSAGRPRRHDQPHDGDKKRK